MMFRISKAPPTGQLQAAVGEDFNLKKHPPAFFRASGATLTLMNCTRDEDSACEYENSRCLPRQSDTIIFVFEPN
jgi:hypothetical protein